MHAHKACMQFFQNGYFRIVLGIMFWIVIELKWL